MCSWERQLEARCCTNRVSVCMFITVGPMKKL